VAFTAQAREQMLLKNRLADNLLAALGSVLHSSDAKIDCNRVSA
jgi:hypothetical protein